MGRQSVTQTILQCPECNNKVEIWRKTSKQKQKGHTKHMWCPYCKQVVGFVELKSLESDNSWYSMDRKVETDI